MVTYNMRSALQGQTKGQKTVSWCSPMVIEAAGGEFRLVFSDPETGRCEETRGSDLDVLCVVFGQDGNTTTRVGLRNPFRKVLARTTDPRAMVSTSNSPKLFWIAMDPTTGWFCLGYGGEPGIYTLCILIES